MKKFIQIISYVLLIILTGHFQLISQVYVNKAASGNNDGSSWQNAYTDLESAVSLSDAGSDLWIAAGEYHLTKTLNLDQADLNLYGSFLGNESDLTQRDFINETVISGDVNDDDLAGDFETNASDNLKHVLFIIESIPLTLDGLVVEGGRGELEGEFSNQNATGGGIFCNGNITFRNCKIRNNSARFGAGIYLVNTQTIPGIYTFEHCMIKDNEGNSFGGGIYAGFGGTALTFTNCTFEDNVGLHGGGLYIDGASIETNATITDCSFIDNRAGIGGAVRVSGMGRGQFYSTIFETNRAQRGGGAAVTQEAKANFTDCTFSLNDGVSISSPGLGGGLYISTASTVNLDSCRLFNNEGSQAGGGIFLLSTDADANVLNISTSIFKGNFTADLGGVLYTQDRSRISIEGSSFETSNAVEGGAFYLSDDTQLEISNSDFMNNNATWGGAILANDEAVNVTLTDCNFVENTCENQGAALYNFRGCAFTVSDCTFERNQSGDWGGAYYQDGGEAAKTSIFRRCAFRSNRSVSVAGAIYHNGSDHQFINCTFFDNVAETDGIGNSISTNQEDDSQETLTLLNCTFHEDAIGLGAITQWADAGYTSMIQSQNCIFSGSGTHWVVEDGQAIFTSKGGNLSSGEDMNGILTDVTDLVNTDPLFTDSDNGDLTLQGISPAVNSGVSNGAPETDITGALRDDTPDRGAYESGMVTSIRTAIKLDGQWKIYGNPVVEQLIGEWTSSARGKMYLQIVSAEGHLISNQIIHKLDDESGFRLDIRSLPSGAYWVVIQQGQRRSAHQFLKF
jgi:hypothetical protein